MEAFQLSFSMVFTLGVCLGTVAVTALGPGFTERARLTSARPDPAVSTQCERLVWRYLAGDGEPFETLDMKTRRIAGTHNLELILAAADEARGHDGVRKDRLSHLRGRVLMRMGRHGEALESMRTALRWNPDHADARQREVELLEKAGSHGLAMMEAEKGLERATDEKDIKRYLALMKNQPRNETRILALGQNF